MVKKKQKNPPIFSHEFVIENHADILAVVLMVILGGYMFTKTKEFFKIFTEFQYVVKAAVEVNEDGEEVPADKTDADPTFDRGTLDFLILSCIVQLVIILQAIVKDYVLDKNSKRFRLSRTKLSRFNESCQLLLWFVISTVWSFNMIKDDKLVDDVASIWLKYPETAMSWSVKLYMLTQIAYWLAMFPSLYFQKVRAEECSYRLKYYSLHLLFAASTYFLYMWKLAIILTFVHSLCEAFYHLSKLAESCEKKQLATYSNTAWLFMYPFTRIMVIGSSVFVFLLGLPEAENQEGRFNIPLVRYACVAVVCISQLVLLYTFVRSWMKKCKAQARLENIAKLAPAKAKKAANAKKAGGDKKKKSQ